MELHKLIKSKSSFKSKKRVGRGGGSGKGWHTVGKGQKGQKARSGNSTIPAGFEGGQVPLYKRLPHIGGFKNSRAKRIVTISLAALNVFDNGREVSVKDLFASKVLKRTVKNLRSAVKILGDGEISKKLVLKGFLFSDSAKEKLEKAGAKILNA